MFKTLPFLYLQKGQRFCRVQNNLNSGRMLMAKPLTQETDTAPCPVVHGTDGVVDWNAALATMGGDDQLLLESVKLFLHSEYQPDLEMLWQGIERADASLVRQAAHRLKGAFAYFGAVAVCKAAGELEKLGHAGELADAEQLVHELEYEIQRFYEFYISLLQDAETNPSTTER